MSAIVRGIFPVLQTAVNDDDGLDVVSLRKLVDFCIQAGAHGLGDADFVPQLEHFAANPLFRGVRFWGQSREDIHQGPFLDNIAHLAARGLVVDAIFPSAYPDSFFDLAASLPELTIVIEYIAQVSIDGGAPDPAWVENMQYAAEFPRVSMKAPPSWRTDRSSRPRLSVTTPQSWMPCGRLSGRTVSFTAATGRRASVPAPTVTAWTSAAPISPLEASLSARSISGYSKPIYQWLDR